jgi:hypothetical protein
MAIACRHRAGHLNVRNCTIMAHFPVLLRVIAPRVPWQSRIVVPCAEKKLLLDKYKITTEAYAHSVRMMRARIGTVELSEYESMRRFSETCRLETERARGELEAHSCGQDCLNL